MKRETDNRQKVAIILADTNRNRSSHLIALELDERLEERKVTSRIFDLADRSYDLSTLENHDSIILIGGHLGVLYSTEIHEVLASQRNFWRRKKVASVINAKELILAEAAEIQLKSAFKAMGVSEVKTNLIVTNTKNKFDSYLNLMDINLRNEIDQFINTLLEIPSTHHSFVASA